MDKLKKLRSKINDIDDQLLKLLNTRTQYALKIGEAKKEEAETNHFFRPERQANIIKRLIKKKSSKVSEYDVFIFWRTIFFLQTKIQGTIEYIFLKSLSKIDKQEVFNFFGADVSLKEVKSLNKAFSLVSKRNNTLLFLKYPTKDVSSQWLHLLKKNNLFVVSSMPLILKKKQQPRLLIVSKNKPVLEGDNTYLYLSNNVIKRNGLALLYKRKNLFMYKTKFQLKANEITFLGAFPSNIVEEKNN